jgi:hypothetical protein
VDGAAYINNIPQMGGTTDLFDVDSRNDALLRQLPPNDGVVATVGNFGVMGDMLRGMGFDIYTTPGDPDPTTGGDFGFVVSQVASAVEGDPPYQLFDLNLTNGALSNGTTVGPVGTPYDFTGGFAVIPEPAGIALPLLMAWALMRRSSSRQSTSPLARAHKS